MPIYEYFCQDCSTKFEKLVSLSRANEQPPCPGCNGGHTEKLLSMFAAIRGSSNGDGYSAPSSGGGCAGCSGGSCATCR